MNIKMELTATHLISTLKNGNWYDLTYDFDENTIYWPGGFPFKLDSVFHGVSEQGYFSTYNRFSAEEHGGTHFDAPAHFSEKGRTLEKVPVTQLVGEGVVIVVTEKILPDRDYQISVEDFLLWEKINGKIPNGAIILLRTGYGQYWNNPVKYLGTSKTGEEALSDLHFPGLHPEAAKWLIEERVINAVGIDTASIDYGQSQDFLTHQILLGNDKNIYENVANLDKLPQKGSFIIALPMKIKNGSGAPLRIVAFVSNL